MAKVKFIGAKLDYDKVVSLYNLPDGVLSELTVQCDMTEPTKNRDVYTLVAYPVDKNGYILPDEQEIKLEPDDQKNIEIKGKKLGFGNMPFIRRKIKTFIDKDATGEFIDYLYFEPYEYGVYVAYKIKMVLHKTAVPPPDMLAEEDLKPSPPAPPPQP